ncbi:laccase [Xylariales sp. PMI_506]|nr:laccase [Xylariales sp. PMI_506]
MLSTVATLLFASLAGAVPTKNLLTPRQSESCNTATTRDCWTTGFNISTDYEVSTPTTGVTRTYDFEITQVENWVGPDGGTRPYVQLVNGEFPGPTITADWGDTIEITVTNSLPNTGVSMHWHGIRQYHNNLMDGVNGVTECPLAPGKVKTYSFLAEQYGTTWYHSHHSGQYEDGVWGPLVINGPASANYDIDLGPFPIGDHYWNTSAQLAVYLESHGPPSSNNILFNGTNVNPTDSSIGEYAVVDFTPNATHRLRIINPSSDNEFQLTLVGHEFTVISTDLVPISPYVTDNLFVGIGQRYDILITADQDVGNYWFNATLTGGCGTSNNAHPAAIARYAGAADALPTNPGTTPTSLQCQDSLDYVPIISRSADEIDLLAGASEVSISLGNNPVVTWYVNESAIDVQWGAPVTSYVLDDNITALPLNENVYVVDGVDTWSYWIFQNTANAPHPMHLHGHDFLVLGHSAAGVASTYSSADAASLNFNNPVRRDVTMVGANGWTAVAFKTDNPGNWVFHCHVAWHVGEGLSLDFIERGSEQAALISDTDLAAYNQVCEDWNAYEATSGSEVQIDSGI